MQSILLDKKMLNFLKTRSLWLFNRYAACSCCPVATILGLSYYWKEVAGKQSGENMEVSGNWNLPLLMVKLHVSGAKANLELLHLRVAENRSVSTDTTKKRRWEFWEDLSEKYKKNVILSIF